MTRDPIKEPFSLEGATFLGKPILDMNRAELLFVIESLGRTNTDLHSQFDKIAALKTTRTRRGA